MISCFLASDVKSQDSIIITVLVSSWSCAVLVGHYYCNRERHREREEVLVVRTYWYFQQNRVPGLSPLHYCRVTWTSKVRHPSRVGFDCCERLHITAPVCPTHAAYKCIRRRKWSITRRQCSEVNHLLVVDRFDGDVDEATPSDGFSSAVHTSNKTDTNIYSRSPT